MGSVNSADCRELETLSVAELIVLCEHLDERVRGGAATLEDFGTLARVQGELSRRYATTSGPAPGA